MRYKIPPIAVTEILSNAGLKLKRYKGLPHWRCLYLHPQEDLVYALSHSYSKKSYPLQLFLFHDIPGERTFMEDYKFILINLCD